MILFFCVTHDVEATSPVTRETEMVCDIAAILRGLAAEIREASECILHALSLF